MADYIRTCEALLPMSWFEAYLIKAIEGEADGQKMTQFDVIGALSPERRKTIGDASRNTLPVATFFRLDCADAALDLIQGLIAGGMATGIVRVRMMATDAKEPKTAEELIAALRAVRHPYCSSSIEYADVVHTNRVVDLRMLQELDARSVAELEALVDEAGRDLRMININAAVADLVAPAAVEAPVQEPYDPARFRELMEERQREDAARYQPRQAPALTAPQQAILHAQAQADRFQSAYIDADGNPARLGQPVDPSSLRGQARRNGL